MTKERDNKDSRERHSRSNKKSYIKNKATNNKSSKGTHSKSKKKDKAAKLLEMHNDVFADIFNAFLFKKNIIDPERLSPGITNVLIHNEVDEENLEDNNKEHRTDDSNNKKDRVNSIGLIDLEGYRDVCKLYGYAALSIVSLGIENQTTKDNLMPLRVMTYELGDYLAQISNIKSKRMPYLHGAITVVLNFGKRRWNKPIRLKECIKYDRELEPFINDYKIHVIDVNFLSDEEIDCLSSDLRGILKVLKDIREDKFEPVKYKFAFKHQESAYRFISSYLDDDRFYKAINELKIQNNIYGNERTGESTMCEALDKLINEGEERGMKRGMLLNTMSFVSDGTITLEKALTKVDITKEEFLDKMREEGYNLPE